jgi:hypothetical protein
VAVIRLADFDYDDENDDNNDEQDFDVDDE